MNLLVEVRVVDDDGKELPVGQTGEFWLRTVTMMKGYWNAPEATAAAIQDGWYKTGDVGYLDEEGYVYISDRMKDMVISAAENIYCAEVERVMAMDEAFVEVALFGVPDDKRGEAAIAAVRLREGYKRTEADVKSLVRKHLADYKVPVSVVFDLGPFPRNASDKTDKVKLRAAYMKRMTVPA